MRHVAILSLSRSSSDLGGYTQRNRGILHFSHLRTLNTTAQGSNPLSYTSKSDVDARSALGAFYHFSLFQSRKVSLCLSQDRISGNCVSLGSSTTWVCPTNRAVLPKDEALSDQRLLRITILEELFMISAFLWCSSCAR